MKHMSKKIGLLILFIVIAGVDGFGQQSQDYLNHTKYWLYRARLRNDFTLVGTGQGMSIPMQQRGIEYSPYQQGSTYLWNFDSNKNNTDGQTAKWGDSLGDIGYYIGVLATEYELLRSNGQNTDQTVYELYCALYALNRLDAEAEVLYSRNLFINTGATFPFPDTPGFMCKDDVDYDFVYNNYEHFNYFGNRGFFSPIKINNSLKSNEHQSCWSRVYYETGPKKIDYAFISQDNYYNVLLGLVLARKYMPTNVTYQVNGQDQNFQDGNSSLSREALNIASRVYGYFQQRVAGTLTYPDGSLIPWGEGGYVEALSFAHFEAFGKMFINYYGNPYYNPTEGNFAFHDECDRHNYLNTGDGLQDFWNGTVGLTGRWIGYYTTSHVSQVFAVGTSELLWDYVADHQQGNDEVVMATNLTAICNCRYDFISNVSGDKMNNYAHSSAWIFEDKNNTTQVLTHRNLYHGQLLRVALNGYATCGYGEYNDFPWTDFNGAASILPLAPCEGTFAYSDGYGPQQSSDEWKTTSRLDHPDRRDKSWVDFPGEYNGLDYMLYHNLYYLVRRYTTGDNENVLVDFTNRHLTLSYPLSSPNTSSSNRWGTAGNPAIVGAYESITADNTLNSNAVVTMKAGKEIAFTPGFSSVQGSQLSAYIQPLTCTDIFNQPNNYDNVDG